jgi:hypothetical protein
LHTCAVTTNNTARCWGYNASGQATPPTNLGTIAQISAGYDHTCAITIDFTAQCWGLGFSNGNGRIGSIYKPRPPLVQLENQGTGLEIVVTNANSQPGETKWSAWDYSTGAVLCQDVSTTSCAVAKSTVGKSYRVKVIFTNETGSSLATVSSSFKNCSPNPELETSASKWFPSSGSKVTITATLRDFCTPYPATISVRERKAGKSWSGWSKYFVSKGKKISFARYPKVPTEFEFKAVSGGKAVVSQRDWISVKPGIKYSLSSTRTYTNYRFAQGGVLTFKINAARSYSGRCAIFGDTEYAYNFALNYMGEEHKLGYFKVVNGYGVGKLQMRWNGVVSASISCESSTFPDDDFLSIRNVTLRANF